VAAGDEGGSTTVIEGQPTPASRAFVPVEFLAGDVIFREGDPDVDVYRIEAGEVRIEVRTRDVDTDGVLAFVGPGAFLGEVGLLTGAPRSASAYAETDVRAQRLSSESFAELCATGPAEALELVMLLGREVADRLRASTLQVAEHLTTGRSNPVVDELVARACAAQAEFVDWSEERVDAMLGDVARAIASNAHSLGSATVAETGIGDAGAKAEKILFGSAGVYASFSGQPGAGLVHTDEERRVREIASPVGVVFAMTPVTEPVSTYVNKVLIALKGRNSIIVSPHRASLRTASAADDLVQHVLADHGAPAGLVQLIRNRVSRAMTNDFMSHASVHLVLATGGSAMVRAAYSSGTPAIGVGPGNAPVWIAPDADLAAATACIVESKAFDHGLVCGAEQHLVVDATVYDEFVAALRDGGTHVVASADAAAFVAKAFTPRGSLLMTNIGQAAAVIAANSGLDAPDGVRLLAFEADAGAPGGAGATERLAPIVTLYRVSGDDEAIDLCQRLLDHEGRGHTAVIHTADAARVDRYATAVAASRILVNVPAAHGCGGSITGLVPSMTLGCGTFGRNSTTDNVGYRNLINTKRVAELYLGNLIKTRRVTSG
jgi:acetaldehyde dehydrogenase/alcohol dehydrogenase